MISPTDLFHPSPAPHFKTFQMFLIYWKVLKCGAGKGWKISVGLIM
jgi:hypothetical protein